MIYRLILMQFIMVSMAWSQTDQWKNVYTQSAWAERDGWQRSDELIQYLRLKKGATVADLGCHEGYITFKLVKVVGELGKVFAVDVEEGKLEKLRKHALQQGINNIATIKGDLDNPKLPANAVDAIIIIDTYHEMEEHAKILQQLKVALKQGGRLVLCEPIDDARRNATRRDQEAKHELGIRFALEDLTQAGFKIIRQQDPFVDREKIKGDKMWLIVAEKP